MKKIILAVLIIISAEASAQIGSFIGLFPPSPDSTARPFPIANSSEWDLYQRSKKIDSSAKGHGGFAISDQETYRSFFYDRDPDSLPFVDFTKNELFIRRYCIQCLTNCKHSEASNGRSCHRNRCQLAGIWMIREKKYCTEPLAIKED